MSLKNRELFESAFPRHTRPKPGGLSGHDGDIQDVYTSFEDLRIEAAHKEDRERAAALLAEGAPERRNRVLGKAAVAGEISEAPAARSRLKKQIALSK